MITNESDWKLLDVTELIHKQIAEKRPNYGVVLCFSDDVFPSSDSFHLGFLSREAKGEWQHLRPALLVIEPTDN